MAVTRAILTKLSLTRSCFIKISYTEFHEGPTDGLVAHTRSERDNQTDGR
jgi:hypothetical protein